MKPKFSCIMPTTATRRWCLPLAVELWTEQRYDGERELLIVTDPGMDVPMPVIPLSNVRIIILDEKPTSLGAKRNLCVEQAAYDWIVFWDDDDWSSPDRLDRIAERIEPDTDLIGSRSMFVHSLRDGRRTFHYEAPAPHLIGGTLAFSRRLHAYHPFPDVDRGEDGVFASYAVRNGLSIEILPTEPAYVAMLHDNNTGNTKQNEFCSWWRMFPTDLLRSFMGGDLERFEAAYLSKPNFFTSSQT